MRLRERLAERMRGEPLARRSVRPARDQGAALGAGVIWQLQVHLEVFDMSANGKTAAAAQPPQAEPSFDSIPAWQCIGCGRIEAPQNCVGICQDRRVEFVYASEHAQALHDLAAATRERDALHRLVRRLAFTKPREGEWERSYRMLQQEARAVLAGTGEGR